MTRTTLPSISKVKKIESLSLIATWVVVLMIPLLVHRQQDQLSWTAIIPSWIQILTLCVVFFINIYFLIPRLLYRKSYLHYIVSLMVVLPFLCCIELGLNNIFQQQQTIVMPSMNQVMPLEFSSEMPPPEGYRMQELTEQNNPERQYWIHVLIAFFVSASAAAYKTIFYWIKEEKARRQIEKQLQHKQRSEPDSILVKADYKIIKILTDEILYIESANEYIKIYLAGGEMIMTFMRLKAMEKELPEGKFLRVQRSYIVNLNRIKAVEKNKIHIEHKKIIPIGEQYKESFQEFLGKNFVN
jgi:hypothetical protein